jgi:L-iditol 2-dehydrogenase
MKAAVLFANEDIRYVDYPEPMVRPGSVKVRVRASGICGSDVPRVLSHGAHAYPIVLGHEFAGDVVEVGEGVTGIENGDTVSGAPLVPCMKCADCLCGEYALCKQYSFIGSREQGSFADYVVIPAANAVKYDSAIPYIQAAMFEPSTVALHGVFCNSFTGGGLAAVLGCGTIGIFTLQWAKIFGAKKTVAFDIDEGRLALARRMGADAAINTRDPGFLDQVREMTGGRGFDSVFESAGNPVTIRLAFEVAGNKSQVCMIGTPHAEVKFTWQEWEKMNRKEFRLTGSWMSYSAPFPGREWELTAHYFATGQLRFDDAFIFREYPMARAAEAFSLYHEPSQIHGKIMLINERWNNE